jgi:hypothetical protein
MTSSSVSSTNVSRGYLDELRTRSQKFARSLHSEKTRLIEFGRFAAKDRKARGLGAPVARAATPLNAAPLQEML